MFNRIKTPLNVTLFLIYILRSTAFVSLISLYFYELSEVRRYYANCYANVNIHKQRNVTHTDTAYIINVILKY